ncbi:MAG: cell division protein FtsZ [Bacteroidales bacterium]|nr:cell division protein FtsZ [Bacteroidales bacterium]
MSKMFEVDMPKDQSSNIKVIGVGGGGSNAVTHMYNQGIKDVDFVICNTDKQALESSTVPSKIQLGENGLGAGSIPEVGRESAKQNLDDIKKLLGNNTKMVFITAGMGGGTGTGAAPVIAEAAKQMDILTVGIVTIPFLFEGRKRRQQAESGIEDLRKNVDSLLIVCNDKIREVHRDLRLTEAFRQADNILAVAAKGIAELITVVGHINVDFEDVKTVMKDSGTAIMGSATGEGENRAIDAIKEALESPLLNDTNIKGASNILLYITSGTEEVTVDEVMGITDYIQSESGFQAEVIWGNGTDEALEGKINVTLIATGFKPEKAEEEYDPDNKEVFDLYGKRKKEPEIKEGKSEKSNSGKVAETVVAEPITEITLLNKSKNANEIEKPSIAGVEMRSKDDRHKKPDKENNKSNQDSFGKVNSEFEFEINENKQSGFTGPLEKKEKNQEVFKTGPPEIEKEEIEKKSQERIRKLKDLSVKLKSPSELANLENVPAYIRKNVELSDTPPASESNISRYSLGEDDENNAELRSTNSYFDAVD